MGIMDELFTSDETMDELESTEEFGGMDELEGLGDVIDDDEFNDLDEDFELSDEDFDDIDEDFELSDEELDTVEDEEDIF